MTNTKIAGYVKRRDTLRLRRESIKRQYPHGTVDKQAQKELDEAEKQIQNLDRKIEVLQKEQQRSSK